MARNKKQSSFEDLIDIAAIFPWWVSVLLSLIIYLALHYFAASEVIQPLRAGQMGSFVTSQISKTFAMLGQYLIPLAFLIGAGISAYERHKRTALFEGVRENSSLSVLNNMTWQEFELLVGEAFRRDGYTVSEIGGGGADGGVDLILRKEGEKFLVQCKQWKALKVGVTTIRELYGVMAAGGAVGGFVVTAGIFTKEAKSFAEGRNIDLIDGSELKAIIKKVQLQQARPQTTGITAQPTHQTTANPSCPRCGSFMVKRTAKQGVNMGKAFWGCAKFPQCRGTIPIN